MGGLRTWDGWKSEKDDGEEILAILRIICSLLAVKSRSYASSHAYEKGQFSVDQAWQIRSGEDTQLQINDRQPLI